MGDQKFIISSSFVLGKARKPLVPAAFAVVSTPTNPHWARVVDYGLFSLFVIHKECLCPSRGDINRLMMMIKSFLLMAIYYKIKSFMYDYK
jgi:hypothetical protein